METYVTSDTHWGHANVIKYSKRPFLDVEEMDATMIERWNSRVKPADEIYHLGDFAFGNKAYMIDILRQLNGDIHLIRGNHDLKNLRKTMHGRFASVRDYHEHNFDGKKLVMCHFPFVVWNRSHYGSMHIHGHTHGFLSDTSIRRKDVGVDTNDFFPYHLDEIVETLESRPIQEMDDR
jgi:calcineurin-like phosphoesterase family protein